METLKSDVIVSGSGMVGLTLGLALAQGGLKVAIADPLPASAMLNQKFDGRVSALSYSSVRMFQALGGWLHLAEPTQAIHDILVTDAQLGGAVSPFSLHFDHSEIGEPMGYIAENRYIRAALFEAAKAFPNLSLIAPVSVT